MTTEGNRSDLIDSDEAGIEQELAGADLETTAITTAELIYRWREWMHRRVESLTLDDDRTATRHVQVDFTTPTSNITAKPVAFVPLALMQKRKLRVFTVTDNSGALLPSVTRELRTRIAETALVTIARGMARGALPPDIRADLELIAGGRSNEAGDALARFASLVDTHPAELTGEQELRLLMFRNPVLAELARALMCSYVLLIPAPPAGERRTMSFSYEERADRRALHDLDPRRIAAPGPLELVLRRPRAVVVRASRSLGWSPRRLWFPAGSVSDARSYHFEAEAPGGLQIAHAELRISTVPSPGRDLHRVTPEDVAHEFGEESRAPDDFEGGSLARTHLYKRRPPAQAWGLVSIELRPRRSTLVQAALFVSVLVSVTLVLGLLFLHRVNADVAGTLLLLGPSALATYVVVLDEDAMTTQLLLGIRALSVGSGLCSFAASALTVVSVKAKVSVAAWSVPTAVSLIISALLLVAWRRARTRPYEGAS